MAEKDAYDEALKSGQYQKPGGLLGKYDNVRRFWEDEQMGLYIRPYLEPLVEKKESSGNKLDIMDIGCGSGDGFELITAINRSRLPVSEHDTRLITPENLGVYCGVDMNDGLLKQADSIYREKSNISFNCADLNECDLITERSYDLYLANYGTLSHNSDEKTVRFLEKIVKRAESGAIIAIDWLGRFSYEWQTLWTLDFDNNQWLDYVISYIYGGKKVAAKDLTRFNLRIMGRAEVMNIYRQVREATGGGISLRNIADRSSFVGRHIDTAQYNPYAQPLRRLVNSLLEPNLPTDLDSLIIDYHPEAGFDEVNAYYQRLTDYWNFLVLYTWALLEESELPEAPEEKLPVVVKRAVSVMKRIVKTAAITDIGNSRANLVEPQLAYCLREIEMGLQQGLGCGHGLVVIFEVTK